MTAYLIGKTLGMTDEAIRAGLDAFENTGLRQKIIETNGYTVIEDCYNASPESMEAALRVLVSLSAGKPGKSVAVLGDMRELGSYAPSLHKRVGSFAADMGVSRLVTFGGEAHAIAEGAVIGGMSADAITCFDDLSRPEDVTAYLLTVLAPGDTVLFKASRAVAMERVADGLIPKTC